jgi:prolyl-tRNA synthetase
VLYDDRHESPGVKFNDADLIGMPVRVVVSRRNFNQGVVEVKRRDSSDSVSVPMDEAVATVQSLLDT